MLGKFRCEFVVGLGGHGAPDTEDIFLALFDHGLPGLEGVEIQTLFPGPFAHVRILAPGGGEQVLFDHRFLKQFGHAFIAILDDLGLFSCQLCFKFCQFRSAVHAAQRGKVLWFRA